MPLYRRLPKRGFNSRRTRRLRSRQPRAACRRRSTTGKLDAGKPVDAAAHECWPGWFAECRRRRAPARQGRAQGARSTSRSRAPRSRRSPRSRRPAARSSCRRSPRPRRPEARAASAGSRRPRVGRSRVRVRMASAAEQLAANINFGRLRQGDRAQEAALVHARLRWSSTASAPTSRCPASTRRAGRDLRSSKPAASLGMFNMFSGGALGAHVDLRARHHAVHLGLDHHAAADDGRRRRSRR